MIVTPWQKKENQKNRPIVPDEMKSKLTDLIPIYGLFDTLNRSLRESIELKDFFLDNEINLREYNLHELKNTGYLFSIAVYNSALFWRLSNL